MEEPGRGRDVGAPLPGTPAQGAVSNSDLDMGVAADGALYLAALSYDSLPLPALPAEAPVDSATTLSVVVGVTRDGGDAWAWTRLDAGPERSHPWVAVAPGGEAHVAWGDGQGIQHVASADPGATWYSWDAQVESLARLAERHRFEWVLRGHGGRGRAPPEEMHRRLRAPVERMRRREERGQW